MFFVFCFDASTTTFKMFGGGGSLLSVEERNSRLGLWVPGIVSTMGCRGTR